MKKILLILTSTILLQACEGCYCPEDADVGDCYPTQNTIDFIPYQEVQNYIFVDENANEIAVAVAKENTHYKEMVAMTCSKGPLVFSMDYVDTESSDYSLKVNDTLRVDIHQGFNPYLELTNPATIDTNFVDVVRINSMRIITDYRGKTLVNPLTASDQGYSYHNSINVVDSTFTAVYKSLYGNLFYTKETGVIGFEKDGVLYRYKRQL